MAISSGSFGVALTGYTTLADTPRFTRVFFSNPNTLRLMANGGAGVVYQVWTTTNLANWTLLGPAVETSPGHFEFTDSAVSSFPSRFYRLRWQQP